MDRINQYQHLMEQVLTKYLEIRYANADIENEPIFDRAAGQYVVMSSGWQGVRRIHSCLVHIKIQDGKIWIERDGTEGGIANELVAAGIPREVILCWASIALQPANIAILPSREPRRPIMARSRRLTRKAFDSCRDGATQMILPDYWLTRPSVNFDERTLIAFDELLNTAFSSGGCPTITFTLPWPKWQFLCYVADRHDIVLHGSGDAEIDLFEPRQSNDLNEFGNQKAVYAASDGLWAMFFAIVDRARVMSITNACIRLEDDAGVVHDPLYVFSVSQSARASRPWRTGTVYLLPRKTFTTQPPMAFGSSTVHIAQLASLVPVQPVAKLTVTPEDFPFLLHIRGHDDQRLQEYATALQTGAPWPSDQ
jgi:hypothetical protein